MAASAALGKDRAAAEVARDEDYWFEIQQSCLGCGVCIRACTKTNSLSLTQRTKRVLTPLNGMHRAVVMAIERGKLQHLLFDNHVLWHHRALAAVLGVILRLPPVAQAMANEQVKSHYLEALVLRFS